MKYFFVYILLILFALSCNKIDRINVLSPSKKIKIEFFEKEDNPCYLVKYKNKILIDTSAMGFNFKNQISLKKYLKVVKVAQKINNHTWEMPWGEQKFVRDHYNQIFIKLKESRSPYRNLNIYFRAYDDGIGFRYEFEKQKNKDSITISDENTEFNIGKNHTCWWIPGDWDIYEHLYSKTKFSQIDALSKRNNGLAQSYIPYNAVNTPITMQTKDSIYLSFHEANLTNYPEMTLLIDKEKLSMKSELVGSDRFLHKAKVKLPFKTPWRTLQISSSPAGLIDSKLILNLNEPNAIGDVSWFKPHKYIGIWWEMHLGKSNWFINKNTPHGATTKNAKKYIDFAAKNNIQSVLVEGWNTGWENWIGVKEREKIFDFTTPSRDYHLEEVIKYAQSKNVNIMMHHETSAAIRTYERHMEKAFQLMKKLGMNTVKTGYVGPIIPKGEYHHGQWMVNHYRKVIKLAAKYKIAVNAHEPIKATGIRRTYPNAISREGLRGQEFNAWSRDGGNPPNHLPTVAFTRMLAGPIDFTPGVFKIKLNKHIIYNGKKIKNQINTTLVHQLALYVVLYSPIQMACDLPKNYKNHPAFAFIEKVGVDWEQTQVLAGAIGEFVSIAREEKDTKNWFVGAITNEKKRKITIDFDFLEADHNYKATIYKDGKGAHWNKNPNAYIIEKTLITKDTKLDCNLASGGGLAISLEY